MKIDSVIFDLDGVITKTALVHSAAWKKMFDEFLLGHAQRTHSEFVEFDHEKDYLPYVDGKPRYKGVESFLESRRIKLPFGDPEDEPEKETICGLGNRKNLAFNEVLDEKGVEVYSSTIELIHELKALGIRVGVASSSKNCEAVLERAGILHLFETRIDGVVSAEVGLKGKPEPDIFTTAADRLNARYDHSVVVEDAVSGVQAGAKGKFGLVLGIARENNHKELRINGADVVVSDIGEIGLKGIVNWFEKGLDDDSWSITYSDYHPQKEKTRETLLTVGNGYIGTRGAPEELKAGEFNYPGTYMAGLYNRLISQVGDRDVENEDFVNCPNWVSLNFRIGDSPWISFNELEIRSIERTLSFRNGLLVKKATVKDKQGNISRIESERFLSMNNPHMGVQVYSVTPLNYSARITLRSEIDGAIINDGVERYRQLNQNHLKPIKEGHDEGISWVEVATTQSGIHIATASKSRFMLNGLPVNPIVNAYSQPGRSGLDVQMEVAENQKFTIEKVTAVYSSQKWDSKDPLADAKKTVSGELSSRHLLEQSERDWSRIWDKIDIKLEGDRLAQKLLRMHLYHLMVSFSPHNRSIDASITARGLHGEAYRGHIFWDELFILPLYDLHFQEVTRAALLYRYRRLDAAREYARQHGYSGAMFPWQSGSDGREETQVVHLNPVTGKWGDDFSSLQRHVSLAVAYNTWQYIHMTNDLGFLSEFGAEMFLEICRFWASKAKFDQETGRYSIKNVMGPDEFHEKYPGSKEGGLKDNTYTNIMVVWAMDKAFEILELISPAQKTGLLKKLALSSGELDEWMKIASGLNIVIRDNILAQYDGYFDLQELDWDHYREKFGNIYRLDRLLKAEGKSADDFKVAKQADTLQIFYNLNEETVTGILNELGYSLPGNYLATNLAYYLARTSHGSTLSRVVHAQLANMINDHELSWELYNGALTSDYADVQGGTTGEGIHAGVMAGTVLIAMQSFAGVDLRGDQVRINPGLPKHWRSIRFRFDFKGVEYRVEVTQTEILISFNAKNIESLKVEIAGNQVTLREGKQLNIKY
jgi:beta-phosphoglucomutase family hydrolase